MHAVRARLAHSWIRLQATFWLLPGLMVIGAMLVAAIALAADAALADTSLPDWVYTGGADGSRALLSTVAGSMVTVAGVGFSITIVALVLASTQFGPRLLSLFMRDVTSQATLGMFTATFTYCIVILRAIRGPDEEGATFVPQIGVTVAIAMTLLSVAALIYFFHHVAVSIQAPRLVATVAHDLDRAIDRHVSPGAGHPGPAPELHDVPDPVQDAMVSSSRDGYVQVVDDAALMRLAVRHDMCVRILTRPGLFVVAGNPILAVRPGGKVDDYAVWEALLGTVIVGDVRTAEDDIEYSVRQLVEVALRALSPAINDPFTAMAAVDWLGGALARLAGEEFPSRHRYDADGRLRIVADVSTFGGITHTIFSRIRHYGGTSPVVLNRLLEAVAAFGPHVRNEADRRLVLDETEAVMRMGRELITSDADLRELERRHASALGALGAAPTAHD